jgi:uncharacterized protein YecE (DUF72 family)
MSGADDNKRAPPPRIGTAGWTIPRRHAAAFPAEGSQLERYTQRLNAAEINSSFHRPHRRETYERWAASVPAHFQFSVKLPRAITHDLRLAGAEAELDEFFGQASGLGAKFAVVLIQLPPSFAFDASTALAFFTALRVRFSGHVAFEPRHASWFAADAEGPLIEHRVARVAADPARVPAAAEPGGWTGLCYFRLHGAPRIYFSNYEPERIAHYADKLRQAGSGERWCIFDNTAHAAATANALALAHLLT